MANTTPSDLSLFLLAGEMDPCGLQGTDPLDSFIPRPTCPSSPLKLVKSLCSWPQEEDEVPDDETLNQMIARREEEFDLFMVIS